MLDKMITVYTDGSSRGNPGPGGWGVIIASPANVFELAGFDSNTTNNRMEMSAVIAALQFLHKNNQHNNLISIFTDSQYVKNGCEKWVYGWQQRNWTTSKKEPVLNQDLWMVIAELLVLFPSLGFVHVPAHVGVPANERVDTIATASADTQSLPNLYKGSRSKYQVSLVHDAKLNSSLKIDKTRAKKSTGKANCYLSEVNGEIKEHQNWADCQARVSGKSGVRFRRANSLAEKKQIILDWTSSLK